MQYGGGFLKRLYGTKAGRFIMPLVLSRGVSKIGGLYTDTFLSKAHIRSFIRKNKIDMQDYEDRKFRSLNDFFTRKVKEGKRPLDPAANALVSPADSKLRVYPVTEDSCFEIKGNTYTVRSLVGENTEISGYEGGMCLVFRLSVDDYHRYCYPDTGKTKSKIAIKGKLHTVCDISDLTCHHRVCAGRFLTEWHIQFTKLTGSAPLSAAFLMFFCASFFIVGSFCQF